MGIIEMNFRVKGLQKQSLISKIDKKQDKDIIHKFYVFLLMLPIAWLRFLSFFLLF